MEGTMRLSTSLGIGILCSALYACSGDENTSDVAGRGSSVSASQLKARCDQASSELEQSTKSLVQARIKAKQQDDFLKQCESKGIKRGPCMYQEMDRDLLDADSDLKNEISKNTEAQKTKATVCAAAFNAEQNVSKSSPAKIPSKGCYVFRGSKTATVDGRQIKLGDGVSSVPVYIEAIVQGPNNEGKHAVVRVRPKGGASRCEQMEVGFFSSELFYPTSAEQAKCNQQCGHESTAISARPAGSSASGAAVGACFKTKDQGSVYKDQFKTAKVHLVGKGQTYYAHRLAGNMVFVTVKSGSYRGSEGWMDRGEIGSSQATEKVACPK
jgi:hypothetical protein